MLIPSENKEKLVRSITLRGLFLNVFLMGLKLFSGIAIGSSALIADGFHSLSDLVTDFIVLFGARMSNKPADETHPYGHKRFETVAAQMIALVLIAVSIGLIWSAGVSIYRHEQNYPGFLILVIAVVSVVSKEIIFIMTRKVSRETGSAALYANAWHHRSDAFSSVAVLLGGIAGLLGWGHADQMAAIVVGFMIIGVAGKILYEGMIEFTEHSADKESIQAIEDVLSGADEVVDWHALRTRNAGGELFVDLHILVDPNLSVLEGHRICDRVEDQITEAISKPVNILVHIEPAKKQ